MAKKRILRNCILLVSILLLGLFFTNIFADGFIIPTPWARERIPPLSVKYRHITVEIINQVAKTSVDQVFINPHGRDIEGTFYFPLPEDAAISEFVMYMGDKKVKGEVLAKEQARKIYEDIVRELRDPAILEYVGRNIFRAKVFPIPAKGKTRVTLSYSQVLKADRNLVQYVYPLNTEKFTPHSVKEVSISAKIQSRIPISSIYSPTHKISVRKEGEKKAQVSFEASHIRPNKDFHLYYSLTEDDIGLSFMNWEEAEGNYFMLLVSPPYVRQKKTIIDKNLIFVLDSSGSMSGEKIKQAKNAVKFIINHLHENDKFALIDFDDGVNLFSTKMVSATPEDRENALRFVDQIVDSGGTNINDALYQAMRMVDRGDRSTYILFLTDGQPTVGVRSTSDILKNIKGANDFQTRIFVFGVGSDINTGLLDFISKENRGTSIYVVDEGNLEVAISSYYEKISSPILSNINIDFERIQVRDVYPRELPDMFKGSQLVLIGKYEGKGPVTVALSGKIGKKEQQFVLKRQKLVDEESYNFLPRLWATRRVGYLLEEIRLHGEEGELVEEIKELGIKFGIVTPYTSFLVKEDDEVAQSGTTFSDRFISDMQVRGREYQSLLRRAEKVRIPDQDKYQSDTPNVKGSRSRDFKATVDGIINVGPMTGSSIPQAGTDAAEELEIILSGAGAEFSREEGTTAIRMAKAVQDIKKKDQAFESTSEKIKYKEDKTFYLKEGYWVDSDYKEGSPLKEIQFNSDEYFQLISEKPGIVKYLSVGKKLIICFEGMNYKIIEEDQAD